MARIEFGRRIQIARAIRACRAAVAEEVTTAFLARHPDWELKYGDRAREFGIKDAVYHQDFLAAAIECGEVEAFVDYCEWAARMLLARDIKPRFLSENLTQIGGQLNARLPAPAADIAASYLRRGVESCLQGGGKSEAEPIGKLEQLAGVYANAALGGHRQAALNLLLEAVRQGHPVSDLYSEVLQAAMRRIGVLWERNEITVAQEHMATAITQFVLAQLYPLIEPPAQLRGRIVVTGVEGEFHQIGANMVADMLEANGWDVRFLGTDTPVGAVVAAVEEHQADVLGVSATLLFNIPNVVRLIDAVRARFRGKVQVLVGGSAFRLAPSLYEEIGANACALDLKSAIAAANGLASKKSVLVADDDAGVRRYLSRILEEAGYEVLLAENGKEAMRQLRAHPVHLVLIDLVMPEQDGLETIPMIKAAFPDTRIIAISGAFGATFLRVAKAFGALDTLAKPISRETLLRRVRQALAV